MGRLFLSAFFLVFLQTEAKATLAAGSQFPDLELRDSNGKIFHLHDFRGKVVVFSFIYLDCPLPTYCPLTNENFQSARGLLERLGVDDKVRLLSISMNPEKDTPARLGEFAANWNARPDRWLLATVQPDALLVMKQAIGLEFQKRNGQIVHNLRTVVLDPDCGLRHVFRGNNWTPQQLVSEAQSALKELPHNARNPAGSD